MSAARQRDDRDRDQPWSVLQADGRIYWLGLARDEKQAWTIALGWPDDKEIAEAKADGMKATAVRITPRTDRPNILERSA